MENTDLRPEIDGALIERTRENIYLPLKNYNTGRHMIVRGSVSPYFITPKQGLQRLEKIMDEYCGGVGTYYTTNEKLLEKGLSLLSMLKEDFSHVGAEDLHQLQRAWELNHRIWVAEAVIRHTLFRKETRWPGYYYRADFPHVDDQNWHVFVYSQYSGREGAWKMGTRPVHHIIQ